MSGSFPFVYYVLYGPLLMAINNETLLKVRIFNKLNVIHNALFHAEYPGNIAFDVIRRC